jgi:hypothetical protein
VLAQFHSPPSGPPSDPKRQGVVAGGVVAAGLSTDSKFLGMLPRGYSDFCMGKIAN